MNLLLQPSNSNPPRLFVFLLFPLFRSFLARASTQSDRNETCSAPQGCGSHLGPTQFDVPGRFPVEWFDKYYNNPNDPTTQPQPIITDPITNVVYPHSLTAPDQVPSQNTRDPITFPPISLEGAEAKALAEQTYSQIVETINSTTSTSNCRKCLRSLELAAGLARKAPQHIPDLTVSLCKAYGFHRRCEQQYGLHSDGPIIAQLLAFADTTGYDGQYICFNFFPKAQCSIPPTSPLDLSKILKSPQKCATKKIPPKNSQHKPSGNATAAPTRMLKVLHFSDFHLDPRYATGSEAQCTTSDMCCRLPSIGQPQNSSKATLPAPRFGYYKCDTPLSLAMAAVQAIPVLTGTNASDGNGLDFSVYTGDLIAHDKTYELSRDYVEYVEALLFENWQRHLGGGPIYAAIGNHDSHMQAQDAPHSLMPERLSKQFSWNYEHLSKLWLHEKWIDRDVAKISQAHYGGYAVKRYDNLKIINLNTDLWYRANLFNYINMTNPDTSGMLEFLAEELQKSQDCGEYVWIVGHVLTGWDGTNPLLNPSNLFYQIVDRYSPSVIKAILWGHTHEDQFQIYYANNGTEKTAQQAKVTGYIGPSITPLTNVNSGFRMYEVHPETYEIMESHTWISDISLASSLDAGQSYKGPTYKYEYSAREAYGKNINWSPSDPLNATWWHLVTEEMLKDNGQLVKLFTQHQGKTSVKSPPCETRECIESLVCYMRSGSASIGRECPQGYGSVQSPHKPPTKSQTSST